MNFRFYHLIALLSFENILFAAAARIDCRVVCLDGINKCGQPFGGCYNPCKERKPIAPPCSLPTPSSTSSCEKGILCIDGITECGEPWGGCFDVCSEPSPTPPPCTPTATPTPTPTPTPTGEDCSQTICIDAVNECGIRYGGCFAQCELRQLSTPPCPPSTFATAMVTPAVAVVKGGDWN